jgi:DNA/RNA endonuclease YhcR with UshA esterase domain
VLDGRRRVDADCFLLPDRLPGRQINGMKKWLFFLAVPSIAFQLTAAETNSPAPFKISTGEAGKYYDREMIVTGTVAQVTIHPKIVFLNLDKSYPDSPFTLVIRSDVTNQFGDLKAFKGKQVEVKGKITNYHDRPEMVLTNTNQLQVTGSTNSPATPN